MTKVAIKNENILLADYFFIELWLEGAAREGAKPQKKNCRPASPVCKPVALKTTGLQSNKSNYSETGRTEYPYDRLLLYHGLTWREKRSRPQP